MTVRRRGDWLVARLGGEFVIMSRQKTQHIGVTEVSARIWELLEAPCEVDAVCAQLLKEYSIPPQVCRAEVDAFLRELVECGAAAIDSDGMPR
jgi:hypothetical protein